MNCRACNFFDLVYKSDSSGNLRRYRCPMCKKEWFATWRHEKMTSVLGEPKNSKYEDWAWTDADSIIAVHHELPDTNATFNLSACGYDFVEVSDFWKSADTEVAFFKDGHYKDGFTMPTGLMYVMLELEL